MSENSSHQQSPEAIPGILTFNYRRYCSAFAIAYVVFTAICTAASIVLEFDLPSSFGAVLAMVSAYGPGSLFFKDHHRVPDKSEKRKFALACMGIIIIVTAVYLTAVSVLAPEVKAEFITMLSGVPVWVWLVVFPLFAVIQYFMIAWAFGQMAKNALKYEKKK